MFIKGCSTAGSVETATKRYSSVCAIPGIDPPSNPWAGETGQCLAARPAPAVMRPCSSFNLARTPCALTEPGEACPELRMDPIGAIKDDAAIAATVAANQQAGRL